MDSADRRWTTSRPSSPASPETGASAGIEKDPEVDRLKSSADLVRAIEEAVTFYEEPPTEGMRVDTPWSEVRLCADDWTRAFGVVEPGTPHNEAREAIWAELLAILTAGHDRDVPDVLLRKALRQNRELVSAFYRAWPLVEANDLVGDLWSVPAYLRRCAPWLGRDEVARLQRPDPQAWTSSDLPFLDAARHRLGDPRAADRQRRADGTRSAERSVRARRRR